MSFSKTPRFFDPPPKEKHSPNKKPRESSSPQFPYPVQQVSPGYGSYLGYLEKEYSPPKSASPKPISNESTPTRKKKEETPPYTSYLDYLEKEFNKNYKPFISHRSSKSPNNSPKSPIRDTGTNNEPEKRPSKSNSPSVHTECTPLKRDTSTRNSSQRKSLDSATTKQHTPFAEPKYRDHHLSHNFDSSKRSDSSKGANSYTQTKLIPQTTNKHDSHQDNALKKENNSTIHESNPNLQTPSAENSSSDNKSLQMQTNNKHNSLQDNSLKKENNTTVHESNPNEQAKSQENSSLDSKSLEHGMNPPENEGKLEPSTSHETEPNAPTIQEEKPVPILVPAKSDSSIHVRHSRTDKSTKESNSKQQNITNEDAASTKEKITPQTTTEVTVTQATPTVSKTEAPANENFTIVQTATSKSISVESTPTNSPKMDSKDAPSKEDTALMSSGTLRQMIAQKLQRTKECGASSLESSPASSPRPALVKRDSALAVEELRRRLKPNTTSATTSSPAILSTSPRSRIPTKPLSSSDSDLIVVRGRSTSSPSTLQPPVIVNQIQPTTTEPTISSAPEPAPTQPASTPSTTISSTSQTPQSQTSSAPSTTISSTPARQSQPSTQASTTISSTSEVPPQANSTTPSESGVTPPSSNEPSPSTSAAAPPSTESSPPSVGPPPPPPPPVAQSPKPLSIKKAKDAPVKKPTSTMDELQQRIAQRRASMDLTAVTQVPTTTPSTKSTTIPTKSTQIPIAAKTTATPPQTKQPPPEKVSTPPVVPDGPDGGPPPPPPPPPAAAPKTPAKKTTTAAAKPKPVNTMDELRNKLSLRQNQPPVDIEKKLLENKQNAQIGSPRVPLKGASPLPLKNSSPALKNAGPVNHMMELQNAIAMRKKK